MSRNKKSNPTQNKKKHPESQDWLDVTASSEKYHKNDDYDDDYECGVSGYLLGTVWMTYFVLATGAATGILASTTEERTLGVVGVVIGIAVFNLCIMYERTQEDMLMKAGSSASRQRFFKPGNEEDQVNFAQLTPAAAAAI